MGRSGWGVVAAFALAWGPDAVAGQLPWDSTAWEIDAEESRVERHLGREALRLVDGVAWLRGVELRDGVVEFDLAAPPDQGFHGLLFRARGEADFEHVYVRPHRSGFYDAVQYTPVFNGLAGWQIYTSPRFGGALEIPSDRWMRVRVAFQDARGEVQVDGSPPLPLPHLVRDPVRGSIGLLGSGAPVWFANVVVRSADEGPVAFEGGAGPGPDPVPDGAVARWRVSSPFPEARVEELAPLGADADDGLTWTSLDAGVRGIANLARVARRSDEDNTVFAAVTLTSATPRDLRVRVGFSDRVRVFLNGRPLYAGSDGWRTRDPLFLGTIGTHDELVLPLEAGENQLWLAVTEDFGGWGVLLVLPEDAAEGLGVPTVEGS